MAGLTKEHVRIINYVEPQGVSVIRTTKGMLFRMPNGSTEMLHYTASDWRATRNFRANLRRNGIEYPGDYTDKKQKRPPYKESIEKVRAAINDLDADRVTTVQIAAKTGMGSGTIAHVMHHIGYWHEYKPNTSRKTFIWHPPIDPKEIVTPLEDMELEEYIDPNEVEIVQELNYAQKALIEMEKEKEQRKAAINEHGKYADTDSMEVVKGWAVSLDDLDGSVTIDQLRMLYMATGLNVEIRVWKA